MNKRILVADSEEFGSIALKVLLNKRGFHVRTAPDTRSIIDIASEFEPDLILLGVMLDDANGWDVCQRLRLNSKLDETKLIMMSAQGGQFSAKKSLSLGADVHLAKPFTVDELFAEIDRVLLLEAA